MLFRVSESKANAYQTTKGEEQEDLHDSGELHCDRQKLEKFERVLRVSLELLKASCKAVADSKFERSVIRLEVEGVGDVRSEYIFPKCLQGAR